MSTDAGRVAVLAGGLSLERDVSLRSGRRIAEALERRAHDVDLVDLDSSLVPALLERNYSAVVLALHGRAGEDGTVQGLLDTLDMPYSGPDPTASALAWDKAIFKGLVSRQGLATPAWASVSSDAIRDLGGAHALPALSEQLGGPMVVKPSQGGAFMGVRFVDSPDHLSDALVGAFSYHNVVLVERFISGTEVAITVLDGEPLPPVEIVPKGEHYDFAARYTAGATDFYVPARLDPASAKQAQETALRAMELTGCRHLVRADLIIDDDGVPWLLELDTCPGMTETSLAPMSAEAGGVGFEDLCERLVELARRD